MSGQDRILWAEPHGTWHWVPTHGRPSETLSCGTKFTGPKSTIVRMIEQQVWRKWETLQAKAYHLIWQTWWCCYGCQQNGYSGTDCTAIGRNSVNVKVYRMILCLDSTKSINLTGPQLIINRVGVQYPQLAESLSWSPSEWAAFDWPKTREKETL